MPNSDGFWSPLLSDDTLTVPEELVSLLLSDPTLLDKELRDLRARLTSCSTLSRSSASGTPFTLRLTRELMALSSWTLSRDT